MRKIILIALSFCMMVSCMYKRGSGNIISRSEDVGSFTGVKVSGGFDVEITRGASQEVTVHADDNLMKYVEVKVVDHELQIQLEHVSVSDAHLKVEITSPEINNITASAGSSVITKNELSSTEPIVVKSSSGSNVKAVFDAPEVRADVSSGGEINLSGHTRNLHASSSSGSSLRASELLSENAYVSTSSGGNAHVYGSVRIEAKASSGGDIFYKGGASVSKEQSSGGNIQREE